MRSWQGAVKGEGSRMAEVSRPLKCSRNHTGSCNDDKVWENRARAACLGPQVVVAAGSLTDMLHDVDASQGRPLVITPASRPDIVLGIGAAQVFGICTLCLHPATVDWVPS